MALASAEFAMSRIRNGIREAIFLLNLNKIVLQEQAIKLWILTC